MAHTKEPTTKHPSVTYVDDVSTTGDVAVMDAPLGPTTFAVPTGPGDLAFDVNAIQGTRHAGPVLCGDPADGVAGIVPLTKRYVINVGNSNFSIPIQFPIGSLVTSMIAAVQTAYNGTTPKINLGTALNGVDAASLALTPVGQASANVPVLLPANGILFLSQVLGASTTGACTVLINYHVPAKTLPT